jgi:hypothetical protein
VEVSSSLAKASSTLLNYQLIAVTTDRRQTNDIEESVMSRVRWLSLLVEMDPCASQ